jgi:hypothetical protein
MIVSPDVSMIRSYYLEKEDISFGIDGDKPDRS